jgi:hypothetical protein
MYKLSDSLTNIQLFTEPDYKFIKSVVQKGQLVFLLNFGTSSKLQSLPTTAQISRSHSIIIIYQLLHSSTKMVK